ncbi:uncharacterized protein LOC118169141 [Oxyura jamaicensis]|uniref:uncharacterized protein LOC118169141 n=1 Tax=Oxyura jamaicensis TaxID=8884 RepID=UPI0015A559D3|nr:uncharacterized protein LOC118169141 [Oxyura jamaicensis]
MPVEILSKALLFKQVTRSSWLSANKETNACEPLGRALGSSHLQLRDGAVVVLSGDLTVSSSLLPCPPKGLALESHMVCEGERDGLSIHYSYATQTACEGSLGNAEESPSEEMTLQTSILFQPPPALFLAKKGNSNNNAVHVAVAQQCSKGEISSSLQLKVALFHKSGSRAFHEVMRRDAAGQNTAPSSTWCSATGTLPGSTDPLLPVLQSLLLSYNVNCKAEMGSQLPVQ